ncbi:TPA: aldo/keto reductase [Candidatus Marinimicrobia bacterium]|nr:MAG: aldo/keto reductase [Marinimicrobia bacterium 46_47]HAE87837.1 aldo/keto reductase [Candidatus Neomarinimicrobiota bacterium]HBY18857.1 aldo/keto reductase [Candidatus Neomarinimicrobiota bacterium]
MNYRNLGKSGLKVSEICFGTMSFTGDKGWSHIAHVQQQEANHMVDIAIDHGINFFDTADIYSEGTSEEMLGVALKDRRNEVVLATKCGFRSKEGPNGKGLSRRHIIDACHESLKRLKTDYIDLYQIHVFDFDTPLEETLSAFDQLIKDGKVRYIGCSNFQAWQLMKALAIQEKMGWESFVSLQAYYSLVGRDLEWELMPLCDDQGLGILPWSPLHGGFLSGKYRRNANWPSETRIKSMKDALPFDHQQGYDIVDVLYEIVANRQVTVAQVALNWLLCQPAVSSVIIGARNEKQLLDNIGTSGWYLSGEEIKMINEVSKIRKPYPNWFLDAQKNGESND